MKIKLFDPVINEEEISVVKNVLKSHFWASGSGIGKVDKFEKNFLRFVNSKSCIAVNSGTAALDLALRLFNIKNKYVILPSLSFVSTAHAVIYNNAKPIFVDINEETLCIDPAEVEEKITEKTDLVLPVHFGGMTCDLDKLSKQSKKFNFSIIEDAAHAVGSSIKGKMIGSHGNAVCFSFHPVKNLAMPSGGAICLNGHNWQKETPILQSLRWCGISDRKDHTYDVKRLGWNYYMNEISAAIGLVQLKKLKKLNKIRQKIAKRYNDEIKISSKMLFNNECSYHLYWIRVKNRKQFIKDMKKKGIETGIHYKPIHKMTFYKNKINLPITEKIGNEIVTIPIHPNLNESEIDFIIKSINQITTK